MEKGSDENITQCAAQGNLLDVLHTASSSNEDQESWVTNKRILNAPDLPKGANILADIPGYR